MCNIRQTPIIFVFLPSEVCDRNCKFSSSFSSIFILHSPLPLIIFLLQPLLCGCLFRHNDQCIKCISLSGKWKQIPLHDGILEKKRILGGQKRSFGELTILTATKKMLRSLLASLHFPPLTVNVTQWTELINLRDGASATQEQKWSSKWAGKHVYVIQIHMSVFLFHFRLHRKIRFKFANQEFEQQISVVWIANFETATKVNPPSRRIGRTKRYIYSWFERESIKAQGQWSGIQGCPYCMWQSNVWRGWEMVLKWTQRHRENLSNVIHLNQKASARDFFDILLTTWPLVTFFSFPFSILAWNEKVGKHHRCRTQRPNALRGKEEDTEAIRF